MIFVYFPLFYLKKRIIKKINLVKTLQKKIQMMKIMTETSEIQLTS